MQTLVAVIFSAFLVGDAWPQPEGVVGTSCRSNDDCKPAHTFCKIASPTCGAGTCSCSPGYAYDSKTGVCKREVELGGDCNPSYDTCLAQHSSCIGGRCDCDGSGFKPGPKGNDCVAKISTVAYGGTCFDSVQCFYYNMACLDNKCGCYPGYKLMPNGYACQQRAIGDTCTFDDDCSQISNAACSKSGNCQCKDGYEGAPYRTASGKTGLGCIKSGETQLQEGQACSAGSGLVASAQCAWPYACIPCSLDSQMCGVVPRDVVMSNCQRNKPAFFGTLVANLVAIVAKIKLF